MQDGMRFNRTVYETGGANICARYWALKMTYYFRLWVEAGSLVPYEYSVEDHHGWREPDEFANLVNTCHNRYAIARWPILRRLQPTGNGTG